MYNFRKRAFYPRKEHYPKMDTILYLIRKYKMTNKKIEMRKGYDRKTNRRTDKENDLG